MGVYSDSVRSRVLTTSRILARARCARADWLRTEDELRPVAVDVEPEPLVRGTVIHAGLAHAFERLPAEPDADAMRFACAQSAVAAGLGAGDARIDGWARVAVRAARALDWPSWEPVRLVVTSGEAAGRVGAPPFADAVAGRIGAHEGLDNLEAGPGRSDGGPEGDGVPLVEHRLVVALPDGPPEFGDLSRGWVYSFKPDAVVRHRATRTVWLWDHKTKSKGTFARVEPWTELHLQTLLYVYALRTLGVRVDAAVLYAVLADEPTVPRLRKDGHLGETSWCTDWPTALEVIARSADPDPESPRYDALRRACAERDWQIPQEVRFTDAELDSAWSHLLASRDELVAQAWATQRRVGDSITWGRRLPTWQATHPSGRGAACGQCEYFAWCREEFEGRDAEALVGSTYRRGGDAYLAEVELTRPRDGTLYRVAGDLHGIDTTRARP